MISLRWENAYDQHKFVGLAPRFGNLVRSQGNYQMTSSTFGVRLNLITLAKRITRARWEILLPRKAEFPDPKGLVELTVDNKTAKGGTFRGLFLQQIFL